MVTKPGSTECASDVGAVGAAHEESSEGVVAMKDLLAERFSSGQGVVSLSKGMSNGEILAAIQEAVALSNGKAFTVIPPQR